MVCRERNPKEANSSRGGRQESSNNGASRAQICSKIHVYHRGDEIIRPTEALALEGLLNQGFNSGNVADQLLWESVVDPGDSREKGSLPGSNSVVLHGP